VGKTEGRISLKRYRRGLVDDIKTVIEGIKCDIFDWIPLLRLGLAAACRQHGS